MAWEDGTIKQINISIDAANASSSNSTKRDYLNKALNSARLLKDAKTRKNYEMLIQSMLRDL
ncbi:MAG: hypothetical protein R3Y35_12075 [Clostridia bacterium]